MSDYFERFLVTSFVPIKVVDETAVVEFFDKFVADESARFQLGGRGFYCATRFPITSAAKSAREQPTGNMSSFINWGRALATGISSVAKP